MALGVNRKEVAVFLFFFNPFSLAAHENFPESLNFRQEGITLF